LGATEGALARAAAAGNEPAGHHRTLRNRVDLAIGAAQGGQNQNAALQGAGVSDGGHGGVDALARLGKGRKRGGDHDGGGVLHADGRRRNRNAHAFQEVGEALIGKDGLLCVPFSGQADHQAVTDQLVFANTLDIDEVLQTRRRERGGQKRASDGEGKEGWFHLQKGSSPSNKR
jgi:hypothetical protein